MKNFKFAWFLCAVGAATFGLVFSLTIDITSTTAFASEKSFPDVTEETRYREAILALANADIIKGRNDFTFRPTSPLLRSEIVKLLMEAEGIEPEDYPEAYAESTAGTDTSCFIDVQDPKQWYFNYLCTAKQLGIAKGYSDGSFQPWREVTRAEAITLLCRTQKWPVAEITVNAPFNDAKLGIWYTPCIAHAKAEGFLKNITRKSKLVLPGVKMQRGVFAELLYRSLTKQGRAFDVPLSEKTPEALLIASQPLAGLTPVSSIQPLQNQILQLTNNERTQNALQQVALSEALTNVAQKHSNNMVIHKFFDHMDHEGKSPDDRRLEASVDTGVGENLAKAPSIETAHAGLMNSPPHRKNILTTEWTRMGIGIAQDEEGYLLITELFSTNPVTITDLDEEKSKLLGLLNKKRAEQNLPPLVIQAELETQAHAWSREMADLNFFSATHPNGETFIDRVKNIYTATLYQVALYESNKLEAFQNLILQDPDRFLDARLRKVGLGFAKDAAGVMALTIILTN